MEHHDGEPHEAFDARVLATLTEIGAAHPTSASPS